MRKSDIIELIRVDMPDHTDGAFDIMIESDDGGSHITIYVEEHNDAQKILSIFSERFSDERILLMRVPVGFLHGVKDEI